MQPKTPLPTEYDTLVQALTTAASLDDHQIAILKAALEAETARRKTQPPSRRKASGTFLKATSESPGVAACTREVFDKEGFNITITPGEGAFEPYRFQRRMRGDSTVQQWHGLRFSRFYPGRTAAVLLGDGTRAPSNMRLEDVLKTYERGVSPTTF